MIHETEIQAHIKWIEQFDDPLLDEIYYDTLSMEVYGEPYTELNIYHPGICLELTSKAYTKQVIKLLPLTVWEHILKNINQYIATEVIGVGVDEVWQ